MLYRRLTLFDASLALRLKNPHTLETSIFRQVLRDETSGNIVVYAKWEKPTGNQYKPKQSYTETLNFGGLVHKNTRKFLTTLDKHVWNPTQPQNLFSQLWDGVKRYIRVQGLLRNMRKG
jgi:hypothetical protein